jgi:hypothetical protein
MATCVTWFACNHKRKFPRAFLCVANSFLRTSGSVESLYTNTQAVTESLWTSIPQQREYSICTMHLSAAGRVDAQRNFRHSFSCSAARKRKATLRCATMSPRLSARRRLTKKRPARFTDGLYAPDRGRLGCTQRLFLACRASARPTPFSSLVAAN